MASNHFGHCFEPYFEPVLNRSGSTSAENQSTLNICDVRSISPTFFERLSLTSNMSRNLNNGSDDEITVEFHSRDGSPVLNGIDRSFSLPSTPNSSRVRRRRRLLTEFSSSSSTSMPSGPNPLDLSTQPSGSVRPSRRRLNAPYVPPPLIPGFRYGRVVHGPHDQQGPGNPPVNTEQMSQVVNNLIANPPGNPQNRHWNILSAGYSVLERAREYLNRA